MKLILNLGRAWLFGINCKLLLMSEKITKQSNRFKFGYFIFQMAKTIFFNYRGNTFSLLKEATCDRYNRSDILIKREENWNKKRKRRKRKRCSCNSKRYWAIYCNSFVFSLSIRTLKHLKGLKKHLNTLGTAVRNDENCNVSDNNLYDEFKTFYIFSGIEIIFIYDTIIMFIHDT